MSPWKPCNLNLNNKYFMSYLISSRYKTHRVYTAQRCSRYFYPVFSKMVNKRKKVTEGRVVQFSITNTAVYNNFL